MKRLCPPFAAAFIISAVIAAQSAYAGFRPESYLCYRTTAPVTIDGRLNEGDWLKAPFTNLFVDIEGDRMPTPSLGTRVKMLWDDSYLYVAVCLEEPNVWGTISKRDDPVYAFDNDLEIFLDVDNDGKWYIEFQVNPINVVYDLVRPNKGAPLMIPWDIEGVKTAVQVDGTLNKSDDVDKGWTVEIAWPMKSLAEHAGTMPIPPENGNTWRIDFPRVEWPFDYASKFLRRVPGKREENWVWCSQGLINNHWPEAWGFLVFSTSPVGFQDDSILAAQMERPFLTVDSKKGKKVKPGSMVLIPGGEFVQGPDPLEKETSPAYTVNVESFYIDICEVTVAEYTAFLNAVNDDSHYYKWMAHHDCGILKDSGGKYSVAPGRENYPVVYVDEKDAEAYAIWAGKRLPTESEWERACRMDDGRIHPWGSGEFTPARCNYNYNYGGTLPVGSLPEGATRNGVLDMAGNVWEICSGIYGAYPGGKPLYEITPQTVYRGGCWASPASMIHASVRDLQVMRSPYVGFRCAKDAK